MTPTRTQSESVVLLLEKSRNILVGTACISALAYFSAYFGANVFAAILVVPLLFGLLGVALSLVLLVCYLFLLWTGGDTSFLDKDIAKHYKSKNKREA